MFEPQKNKAIPVISLFTTVVSLVVMTGWVFGIPGLKQVIPGFDNMVFNTAFAFVLFGGALLTTQSQAGKYRRAAFLMLSAAGALVGIITLAEFLLHINTGLDQLFITDSGKISYGHPFAGRMAFNTSMCLSLLGIGFVMLVPGKKVSNFIAQYLFHTVTALAAIALIGYLYGVSLFNSLLYMSSMATHTAVIFLVLSVAASLLNPSLGVTKIFTGNQLGNQLARRLFSLIVLMIFLFASLKIQTYYDRSLSLGIGISLLAVCFLLVSLAIIWNTGVWLNKIDAWRSKSEEEIKSMNSDLEKRAAERTAELRKSEAKYRMLVEQASDAIYIVDSEGHFTDVNESMCTMMGYTRDELLHMRVENIIDPEELKVDPIKHGPHDPNKGTMRERTFLRKNGTLFNAEINVKMFQENHVLVIARDITDRKRMETELREAEVKFRTIAEKSMVGVYISRNERLIYVNPRFAQIFGYEPHELLNEPHPIETIICADHHALVREQIRARQSGEIDNAHYEVMGKKKDGTTNWVEFYGSSVTIGGETAIIGTMLDITERKEADNLILKEKILSDTIINSLPGIFYLINDQGKHLRWNRNVEVTSGYSADEIDKAHILDLIAPEDHETIMQAIERVYKDGYAMVEAKVLTKDGSKISWLLTGIPIWYENQQCLLGTGMDITPRIKAEEELRSSEQKYKLLFESNPLPLWMIAKDTMTIIDANESTLNLYGYTRDELQNMDISLLRPLEDRQKQLEGYQRDMTDSSGDYGIVRHLKKDGTIMYVHIIAHDIMFDGRPVRLSFTNDVTEKLIAEESLQKSEANLQTIMRTTDTAYALFNMDMEVLTYNQMAGKFVEEQFHHLLQKGDTFSSAFLPADKRSQLKDLASEVLRGNSLHYEIDYPQEDGSVRWYFVRWFPILSDTKEILGMMMALDEITERKNAEENLKNAYSRIQDHISSIKAMAWKQSHVMRSPVANLKALAGILQEEPGNTQALDHFMVELNRLDSIIHEMAEDASDHVMQKGMR